MEVELTDEVRTWLERECHPDRSVRDTVRARFLRIFDRMEQFGLAVVRPKIARREGRQNLWEARVQHKTGAYRLFFGIARGGIAVFACGYRKKSDTFPPHVYDTVEQRVRMAVRATEESRKSAPGR